MKLPRGSSRPLEGEASPVIAHIAGPDDKRLSREMRATVERDARNLSRAARQARASAGGGRGVFSLELGAGSRPGTSDATFIGRDELATLEDDAGEAELAYAALVLAAVDAFDPEEEFVLQVIGGPHVWAYRVRHDGAASGDLPGRPPTLAPQFAKLGREVSA